MQMVSVALESAHEVIQEEEGEGVEEEEEAATVEAPFLVSVVPIVLGGGKVSGDFIPIPFFTACS